MDNSKIQTLDDLIVFGKNSEYSIHLVSILCKYEGVILLDRFAYEKYEHILRSKCVKTPLTDQQYHRFMYKPELLSSVLYDTPNLDHLILFLNGGCLQKFNKRTLTLLPPSEIANTLEVIIAHEADRIDKSIKKAME